jgi:protein-L-isoaspartate(D-aspartate) O-methyltransferase
MWQFRLWQTGEILNLRASAVRRSADRTIQLPVGVHMLNIENARRQMIEQQVRTWEVLDPVVLEVLQRVPREQFVEAAQRDLAFADMFLPIGQGECMLPPKLEGRILQAMSVGPDDRVLEVGTGSGFFAACLAALGRSVRSLELHSALADAARGRLQLLGFANVEVEHADAMAFDSEAGYDVIVLTGSLPVYDRRFERGLAVGGRLFAVAGPGPIMQARRITRVGAAEWLTEDLFETSIPALRHAPLPPRFVF